MNKDEIKKKINVNNSIINILWDKRNSINSYFYWLARGE